MRFLYLILLFFCSCSYLFKQDGPVEEIVEEVIEKETGIDIDLSPGVENATPKR